MKKQQIYDAKEKQQFTIVYRSLEGSNLVLDKSILQTFADASSSIEKKANYKECAAVERIMKRSLGDLIKIKIIAIIKKFRERNIKKRSREQA